MSRKEVIKPLNDGKLFVWQIHCIRIQLLDTDNNNDLFIKTAADEVFVSRVVD